MKNGEYIFYADESGDHSLVSIDSSYPIFVLTICGFAINDYAKRIVPDFQRLKFAYFGHDMVVFHEREIRKQSGDFVVLRDMALRERFLTDLTRSIQKATFRIYACIIDKRILRGDFFPDNPYELALTVSLQAVYKQLKFQRIEDRSYYFIFEKRGDKEDRDLELAFRRIVDGENPMRIPFHGFKLRFADKKANSTGMQIADLTARPLGLGYLHPKQENRAINVLQEKCCRLKPELSAHRGVFMPAPKSEKPR